MHEDHYSTSEFPDARPNEAERRFLMTIIASLEAELDSHGLMFLANGLEAAAWRVRRGRELNSND